MKRNVIILTSGLTGSSVLTGLITRAGYWAGDTHKKTEYDTFENRELIQLNRRIFKEAGYGEDFLNYFSEDAIRRVTSVSTQPEDDAYLRFVKKCGEHQPWVWKDPRLWMTIRFWKNIFDLRDCQFIVLTRGFRQLWVSKTLRRQIVTYRASKAYEEHVKDSAIEFLKSNNLPFLRVRYEDLIVHPAETIATLNNYLGANLTVEDLGKTYHKPLYELPGSSMLDFVKAGLIYLKNYQVVAAEKKALQHPNI